MHSSKGSDDNRRVLRVEKALRETISSYLLRSFHHDLPAMVSVPFVRASKDLRQAKVYVSVFGKKGDGDVDENGVCVETEECLEILNQYSFEIQGHIGRELKMKFCPKLRFYSDESQQTILKVDRLLHQNSQTSDKNNGVKNSSDE